MPVDSPFTDKVVPTAGNMEKANLGTAPDAPTAPKTGEPHNTPYVAELPVNTLRK